MTNFFNKFKQFCFGPFLGHFPNFEGKIFPQRILLSRTTSYRFLAPSQNLERTHDTIATSGQMERWTEGQTDPIL